MKEFLKMTGAVIVGLILWSFTVGLLSFIFMMAIVSSFDVLNDSPTQTTSIDDNSILKLDLSQSIAERTGSKLSKFYSSLSLENTETIGLQDVSRALEHAANDDRIKALYLSCHSYNLPDPATAEAIRNMILDFKLSGKPVYAFSYDFNNFDYYVATAADSIFMRVGGDFQLCGLGSESLYYKGALDKFDIDVQVIRHGKFKSAVEPFLQETMSEANKEQISKYLNDFWDEIATAICDSRGISRENLEAHANSLDLYANDDLCMSEDFVDGIIYESDMKNILGEFIGNDNPNIVSLKNYNASFVDNDSPQSRIVVIYADGEIVGRKSSQNDDEFTSKDIVDAINKVKDDEDVRGVVLRVNSPGGSAVEAEVIHEAILQLKESKPVVVSMGGYAASGGYYISAPANYIFAQNNTITGSIGVYGLLLSPGRALKNTLGINIQRVNTHKHGGSFNSFEPLNSEEIEIVQRGVEKVYSEFVNHVADGRNMTFQQVDEIAQGRVWTGKSAKEIGLVDEIGNLNDAINYAAELADIKSFKVKELPETDDSFTKIFNYLMETSMRIYYGDEFYNQVKTIKNISKKSGIQAYMPKTRIK